MSEFIDNPFNGIWEAFDIDAFKKALCDKIDTMYQSDSAAETVDLLSDVDEMMMGFMLALRLKGIQTIEVIKMDQLPKKLIEELGLEDEDIIDGYVPKDLIPEELLKLIEPEKKKRKNKWLIDE